MDDEDPRAIRSVAVTTDDVVAAHEARQRSPRRPVLRVTPPFTGRMRARLHDPGPAAKRSEAAAGESAAVGQESGTDSGASESVGDRDPATGAVHLPPARFLDADAIGPFPAPDDTEDALRADPEVEFTVERHRERHVEAVEAWRETVRETVMDEAVIRLDGGEVHRVEVKTLGDG
ncbi:hypothetical protein M0R88_01430 [Halorussus gelatinilyticus]|uniref:DUF8009 domain-containing protein n=1 Tax=Halorussus gelatinilyticus TaxID=2937524 RepID=A0A8U0IL63_9EURY|nr:hypothetical protein [Halorussus gelatinilyticus]UPW00779.1 hypothetical protein M0R88_01430 [Halorussus gelatinilyticus]